MPLIPFKGEVPNVAPSAFIAPNAWVTGKVSIADEVTILFGASLRGDIQRIIIGRGSNIQDNAVLHTSKGRNDCTVGKDVTIGHCTILHGCRVHGRAIIGMNATILDDAEIEKNCIIGAQSLVPLGMRIPEGSLALGVPAKIIRQLTQDEIAEIEDSARRYVVVGREYKSILEGAS